MANWSIVPLSEVFTERQETPSPQDLITGKVRIVSKIGFDEGRIELREGGDTKTGMILIRPGDLVISGINAIKGAIAVHDEKELAPIAATIHYSAYSINKQRADIHYMWLFLRSRKFRDIVLEYIPGGIKTELKASRFLSVPISLPPLDEQRRIVGRVEALAARVAEAQKLRREAEKQATAMIKAARNSAIGENPNRDWLPLSTFIVEILNGKSPNCEKRPASPGEWGVLKVGAISFGVFDESQNKALPPHIQPNPEYEVKSGDFLMIRANTKELVGACAIVKETRPKLLLSDKTFRFVFRKDKFLEKKFLNHVLKSPALRTQIELQATGTSPTMKNISKEKVMKLLIPVFSEDEQQQLVAYLDGLQAQVDELQQLQGETQEELDALLPSILDKAFKGE